MSNIGTYPLFRTPTVSPLDPRGLYGNFGVTKIEIGEDGTGYNKPVDEGPHSVGSHERRLVAPMGINPCTSTGKGVITLEFGASR